MAFHSWHNVGSSNHWHNFKQSGADRANTSGDTGNDCNSGAGPSQCTASASGRSTAKCKLNDPNSKPLDITKPTSSRRQAAVFRRSSTPATSHRTNSRHLATTSHRIPAATNRRNPAPKHHHRPTEGYRRSNHRILTAAACGTQRNWSRNLLRSPHFNNRRQQAGATNHKRTKRRSTTHTSKAALPHAAHHLGDHKTLRTNSNLRPKAYTQPKGTLSKTKTYTNRTWDLDSVSGRSSGTTNPTKQQSERPLRKTVSQRDYTRRGGALHSRSSNVEPSPPSDSESQQLPNGWEGPSEDPLQHSAISTRYPASVTPEATVCRLQLTSAGPAGARHQVPK